jgi:hypothetical protein
MPDYASPPRYKGRSGHRYFEAQWRFLETASKTFKRYFLKQF